MGRSLWGDSTIEKAFFALLEFDSNVKTFQPQPLQIHYTLDGVGHVYTPDVLVTYRDGSKTVFEVKPDKIADSAEWKLKFRVVRSICAESGYGFRVARESEILRQPRFNNIRLLSRYSRVATGLREQIFCEEFFTPGKDISIREAKMHFRRCGLSERRLNALIFQGFLIVDIDAALTGNSLVWRAQQERESA